MVAHEIARRGSAAWKPRRLLKADVAEVRVSLAGVNQPAITAERVILATTRTYMNDSGIPVRNLVGDLRLKPDHLIVVHDELDLDLGQLRAKSGGGDNGHNGLKSIRALAGTGEFYRVRVGIGRPPGRMEVTDWVLTGFRAAEKDQLHDMVVKAADAVQSLILDGLEPTQSRYNS
jgi:PTH1 family peptidyl-tRNA hydrolase